MSPLDSTAVEPAVCASRVRAKWRAGRVGVLAFVVVLELATLGARPAAADPEDASAAWLVLGAVGVGASAALETATYVGHRNQTVGKCNTATCFLTWWPVESLVEPTGASFLFVWAWQRGDYDGRMQRRTAAEADRTTMRTAGITVAALSYGAKFLIANYAFYKAIDCSRDGKTCAGDTFSKPALLALVLTPPMALGALAGGYGTGYERGRSSHMMDALHFQPAVIPGGAILAYSSDF